MKYWTLASILVLHPMLADAHSRSNLIQNGSFEINGSSGCAFNQSNSEFNSIVPEVFAFGGAQEIDIMKAEGACGWGLPPQSGRTKLGISGAGDAFAMALSQEVSPGKRYRLELFANAALLFFPHTTMHVEVGISSDPTSFGTLVLSGSPSPTAWTQFAEVFEAPHSASFVTVRCFSGWSHVDNFSLVEVDKAPAAPQSPVEKLHKMRDCALELATVVSIVIVLELPLHAGFTFARADLDRAIQEDLQPGTSFPLARSQYGVYAIAAAI